MSNVESDIEADFLAGQPVTPATPDSPATALELEERFLAELQRLVNDRAAAETRIESQFASSLQAAERIAQRSREALDARITSEQQGATSDLHAARRQALGHYDQEIRAAESKFAAVQQKTASRFEALSASAKRGLEEDLWEAEAFYSAHKNDAPKQLEAFQQQLDAWLARLRSEHADAHGLLQSWRQTVPPPVTEPASDATTENLTERLQERITFVIEQRARLGRLKLPYVAASPSWLAAYVLAALLLTVLTSTGMQLGPLAVTGLVVLAAAIGVGGIYFIRRYSQAQVQRLFVPLDQAAMDAERLAKLALADAQGRAAAQQAALVQRHRDAKTTARQKHDSAMTEATRWRDTLLEEPAASYARRIAEIENERDHAIQQADESYQRRQAETRPKQESELAAIEDRSSRQAQQVHRRRANEQQMAAEEWRLGLTRLQKLQDEINGHGNLGPAEYWRTPWEDLTSVSLLPVKRTPSAMRFGEFEIDLEEFARGAFEFKPAAQPLPHTFKLPALLAFPQQPSMLLKADGEGRRAAVAAIQAMMLRLVVSLPPDKVRFTIIDPVGLGDNFAAFMHLADYNEALVTSRIWTEPRHIEQQLADLSEHMENVIQNYLRNEYNSIEEYNRQAGDIAEPFRFLVIANFPANFSEAAQRRLLSIVSSGPRCGVYTLIMVDRGLPQPPASYLRDLQQQSATLVWTAGRFVWEDARFGRFPLMLDIPPDASQLNEILHSAGQLASRAGRVEVAFDLIAPAEHDVWSMSTRSGIDVPLGVAGATRRQHLRLGQGTSQHVLIAGKTGSGKSTLLHALVTNLALRYSPDELELYLVDFKQGVEFKAYATHELPHARIVAIESDREFGISVLNRLDSELRERADRFRALGVQDLPAYRHADPRGRMPRIVLIVDEFQEFFVEDDKISQDAALLLDRLVRQGRAFGIHVILGSQTLAGAYTLARSTIGQIAVRIALQCSEADAHLILSEDNTAARLLSRPGEAIYNDANGLIEGNQRFQIVWLPDERREEYLEDLQDFSREHGHSAPSTVVFEGNIPADPARNEALAALLDAERPADPPLVTRAFLGEPVAIKDPTSVLFRRQSGNNLVVVGQNEQVVLGMLSAALVSLVAQHSRREALTGIYIFDGSAPGSQDAALIETLAALAPGCTRLIRSRDAGSAIGELSAEVERRQQHSDTAAGPIHVIIYGLHKFRDLRRQEDDFGFARFGENPPPNPAKQLTAILRDGPPLGVHAIVWCDNVNSLNRAWDRQTLREFEMRIALQMSTNDSSTLIDTPLANRLGMHRALLSDEEHAILEKFRPYNLPSQSWLDQVRQRLNSWA